MTTRMQVTLSAQEHQRAKAKAADAGLSLAAYIRRLVAQDAGQPSPRTRVEELFDLGESTGSDVTSYKDDYVGEAVAAGHPQPAER